jgi:hypothetical protein
MERDGYLTVEERARILKIQDSLIDRYAEQKEAIQEGNRCRAVELEFEIKELLREKRKSSSEQLSDRPVRRSAPFESSANQARR